MRLVPSTVCNPPSGNPHMSRQRLRAKQTDTFARAGCKQACREARKPTKAAPNAAGSEQANLRDLALVEVHLALLVNVQRRHSIDHEDAAAVRYGDVVVLTWRNQQNLHTKQKARYVGL